MERSLRPTLITSALVIVSFVPGLALLGELAGSVGEPDAWFTGHFDSSSERVEDIVGSVLLVVAAIALLSLVQLLVTESSPGCPRWAGYGAVARAAGGLSSAALLFAGLAFATTPLSIEIGRLYDDPAFVDGRAVLPQFGYAALTIGAMVPAAVMIVSITRLQPHPRWVRWPSYVIAGLLPVMSLAVAPIFFLFPGWVALNAAASWRAATRAG